VSQVIVSHRCLSESRQLGFWLKEPSIGVLAHGAIGKGSAQGAVS